MPKRTDIKKVMVIGSGPIVIGQAADDYKVGEQVKVSLTRTMGYKAVVISYLFPLIILTILLLYLQNTYQNELIAGLGSIAGVAVYYFFVWLLKDKLENKFSFTIEKL